MADTPSSTASAPPAPQPVNVPQGMAAHFIVLNIAPGAEAQAAVQAMHGLNMADYIRLGDKGVQLDGFFPFPDGSGFWLTYIPEKHGGAPPPF